MRVYRVIKNTLVIEIREYIANAFTKFSYYCCLLIVINCNFLKQTKK